MSSEAKLVVNFKTNNGTILTARGDDEYELASSLTGLGSAAATIGAIEHQLLTAQPQATVQAAFPQATVAPTPAPAFNSVTGVQAPAGLSPVPTPQPAAVPAGVESDKWGNTYQRGLPNAPLCDHQVPRVWKSGKNKAGKQYNAWVCSQDAPGGNYKLKCEPVWPER